MKLEDLILIVRADYLDDSRGDELWDEDFMFRSFTEAQRQACNRQNLLFSDDETISLNNGVSTYDLPQLATNIKYVGIEGKEVKHQSVKEVEASNPAWRTESGVTGKSVKFIIRGNRIRFIPMPDANDNGLKVTFEMFRLPYNAFTSISQQPEIPEEFHRDLIYWVLHEAYKKQDADTFSQERSDYFLNRFSSIFGEYISAEVRLNQFEQRKSLFLRPTRYTAKLTTSRNDDW